MARILIGTVVSTKMQNTVAVKVERKYQHPVYGKVIKSHKKYLADNPSLKLVDGDVVKIEEVAPISKQKHYRVMGKVEVK